MNIRDGGKHALVDGEEKIGHVGAANGRRSQHIAEPNVLQVAQKFAGGMAKGETITPEEPLRRQESAPDDHDNFHYERLLGFRCGSRSTNLKTNDGRRHH